MALSGFICHDDYLAKTAKLTDEEVGRLFRALMAYHATGEEKEITGREWLAFDFIREDIDRAEKAHDEKCRQNRRNRMGETVDDPQPPKTDDNERQRSSTDVNDGQRSTTYKDKDKEKEKDNDKDNNKRERRTFTPPTVEEVAAYCKERNNGIDAEYFVAYYENRKWELSNGKKMANWHLAIVTWEKNGFNKTAPVKTVPAQNYSQRDYSGEQNEAFERMIRGAG